MAKLHEILPVESSLKGAFTKILAEAKTNFDKKNSAYTGKSKIYSPVKADDLDIPPAEVKAVGYTVKEKLKYISDAGVKYFDAMFQKESTNTHASAQIVATMEDDTQVEITKDKIPATVLLSLEDWLTQMRGVYDEMPTLDPNQTWKFNKETGIWETPEHTTLRTKKVPVFTEVVKATDHHPAQVARVDDDVVVGHFKAVERSGAVPVVLKHQLLSRLDILIRAVRTARARANDTEIKTVKIGRLLTDFLQKDLV